MSQVQAIPPGLTTVTPHLICRDAASAIDFYSKALGATEISRLPGPQGRLMHAMIRVGDAMLMLVDEFPEFGSRAPQSLGGSPVVIHLYVQDADAAMARAMAAGATVTMPVSEQFWGDRYGQFQDPFGHRWSVATHVRDVPPEEWAEGMSRMAMASGNGCGQADGESEA